MMLLTDVILCDIVNISCIIHIAKISNKSFIYWHMLFLKEVNQEDKNKGLSLQANP